MFKCSLYCIITCEGIIIPMPTIVYIFAQYLVCIILYLMLFIHCNGHCCAAPILSPPLAAACPAELRPVFLSKWSLPRPQPLLGAGLYLPLDWHFPECPSTQCPCAHVPSPQLLHTSGRRNDVIRLRRGAHPMTLPLMGYKNMWPCILVVIHTWPWDMIVVSPDHK